MNDDDLLLIMSDHGFGPVRQKFYLNKYLIEKGYLSMKRYRFMYSEIIKRVKQSFFPNVDKHKWQYQSGESFRSLIDWDSSKAYFGFRAQSAIFLNDKFTTKEKEDVTKRLKQHLTKVSEGSKSLISEIWSREEIYDGLFQANAPDILFWPKKEVTVSRMPIINKINPQSRYVKDVSKKLGGDHEINGIFLAYGKNVKASDRSFDNLNLMDIAPTLLYYLKEIIPNNLDGRVLTEIFTDQFLKSTSPKSKLLDLSPEGEFSDAVLSEKEKEDFTEALEDLGYL